MNIKPIEPHNDFVWIIRRCIVVIVFYISLPYLLSATGDNYPVGSREAALGGAGVMSTSLWSASHNQAGLGFYPHLALGVHHENKFCVPEFSLHSLVFSLPTGTGTFSLNYSYFGYPVYNESKIGLGFGKALNDKFSAGIQFDYLHTYIDDETGNHGAVVIEAGILARPVKNLLVGFHIFNPTHSYYSERIDNEHIPMIFKLGIGYNYQDNLFICFETEKNLEWGPVFYKAGIEYRILPMVSARTGVKVGDFAEHSFGLGLILKNIRADIAFSRQQVLGYTPHFSLQYTFR
jgi:hypothetical protein